MAGTAAVVLALQFAFFVAPFAWTDEPARLAAALHVTQGMTVADIGAGSGALAIAIAPIVGPTGSVLATELNPRRLREIQHRIDRAGLANVRAVAAGEHETQLPDECCHAIYMRAVFHHITERPQFAASVRRALIPGARLAVIDFTPGRLWFLGVAHGVDADEVERVFREAGLRLTTRNDRWGGGSYLIVFERAKT